METEMAAHQRSAELAEMDASTLVRTRIVGCELHDVMIEMHLLGVLWNKWACQWQGGQLHAPVKIGLGIGSHLK